MNRRDFFCKSGGGMAGMVAGGAVCASAGEPQAQRKKYTFELEVVEAAEDSHCHPKGDKFKYPEEWGKVCPWMRDSMSSFLRVMENGGSLFWTYEGTPYKKEMDPDGVTTEFVRCPDPTRKGIVVKIIRTLVS